MTASHEPIESVDDLISAAAGNDQQAWRRLIARFAPLVASVAHRFRLSAADVEDISQVVWLRLFENLGRIRDPAALPGWLTTTTRRESIRLLNRSSHWVCLDSIEQVADHTRNGPGSPPVDHDLLQRESIDAVRCGLKELPDRQRDLLLLGVADPPVAYSEIAATLDMPVGSIGPTRGRSLARLRQTEAIRDYFEPAAARSA
jgi:RNA polymerase sigma factor (sigma-70 family)